MGIFHNDLEQIDLNGTIFDLFLNSFLSVILTRMRPILLLLWIMFFLISCGTTNRIIEIEDSFKEIKEIKLAQNPEAHSSENIGSFGVRKNYNLKVNYLFQQLKEGQSILVAEFQMNTPVETDELDSILFFDLDHEKVRLISTANNSSHLMKREFMVPENLWVPIVHSQEIFFRLYVGKEGVDVILNASEISKVKEFFRRAIHLRDAGLPPVPEGQKKW